MTSSFFSNTKKSRIDGGEYLADRDSPATFFKDSSDLMITGGRYGTVGGTDTSQSSTSNATRSSTEGHDRDSYPARHRQSTRQSEVNQDSLSAYRRERKVSSGSILENHQVENDPESYGSDTDQPTQRSHNSRTAASAWRTNAAPPYNKGSSGSSQGSRGERSDTGRSSSKFQGTPGSPPHTNAHEPASRTNTALVPSAPPPSNKGSSGSSWQGGHGERSDTGRSSSKFQTTPGSPPHTNAHVPASRTYTAPVQNSTYYVSYGVANPPSNPPSPPPPPKPPKPDELKKEMSTDMGPPLTRRNPDPNREGSYPHPPPSLSMDRVTIGPGGYPSPGPSPPRGQTQTLYHSPTGNRGPQNQNHPSPLICFPEPQLSPPHNAGPFAYPSPKVSPQDKGPHRGGSYPLQGRSSPTPHVPRGHAPPANMHWQKSESSATSSHGGHHFTGNAPPLTRTMTMPEPVLYGAPTGPTTTTSQHPYGSPYSFPPQYDASMHHGGQPYAMTMPTSPPSNYPGAHDNYFQGAPPPSRRDEPSYPPYHNR